jgi:cell shape-determining protein MreD
MNWTVFGIFAYLLLVLQTAAAPSMELPTRFGAAGPQFVLVLGVVVGLFAAPRVVYLAWGILGLLVDLVSPFTGGQGTLSFTLVGPHVLGYLAAGFVLLQLRSMVFRQHPFSTGFSIVLAGAAAELVVVLLLSLRGMYEAMPGFSAMNELALRGISLLYSGVVGTLLAVPLLRLIAIFGFPTSNANRPVRWGR